MEKNLQLLKDLNWFLEPISKVFLFLFTSTTGYIVLGIGFLVYLISNMSNSLLKRQLSYGKSQVPPVEKVYVVFKSLLSSLANFITKIPLLLGIILLLGLVTGLSSSLSGVTDYFENEKKIKELSTIVNQLNESFKVAEIKVTEQVFNENDPTGTTSLEVKYFDYAGLGVTPKPQTITIKGNDIYFDAIVINFEYSQITGGTAKNLTIPYRIFSNEVPAAKGIPLNINDENGIPFFFKKPESKIYGMSPDAYNKHLSDIINYVKDDKMARLAGVRSSMGNAVHQRLSKNSTIQIWIEQTGGLVIKNSASF